MNWHGWQSWWKKLSKIGPVNFQTIPAVLVRLRLHIRAFIKIRQVITNPEVWFDCGFTRIRQVSAPACGSDAIAASQHCFH